ncbi:hypothetical protein M2138_000365 [Dysgonomonadaceae bacterium PH5-43]|nr:hypothetical protein [Dysgonomonadaceae bacterium PH5-43]
MVFLSIISKFVPGKYSINQNQITMKGFNLFKNILMCIFLLLSQYCFSVDDDLIIVDTRSFALGNIRSLSSVINPANISFVDKSEIGTSVLNRFGIDELNTAYVYCNYPNNFIDCGVGLSTFGYEDYKVSSIRTSFAKKIISQFSIGINIMAVNKSSVFIEESVWDYYSHLGLNYTFSESFTAAMLAENLLTTETDNIINVYLGSKYVFNENISLLVEGSYRTKDKFDLSLGFEYYLLERFVISSGVNVKSKTPSFGITYIIKEWTLDAGFSLHNVLGLSSSIGVSYSF